MPRKTDVRVKRTEAFAPLDRDDLLYHLRKFPPETGWIPIVVIDRRDLQELEAKNAELDAECKRPRKAIHDYIVGDDSRVSSLEDALEISRKAKP